MYQCLGVLILLSWMLSWTATASQEQHQQLPDDQQQQGPDHLLNISSKPLNILLVSLPLWGHINPLLAVAEELLLRGHEVTFCLGARASVGKFEERMRRTGIKYCHFESDFEARIQHISMKQSNLMVILKVYTGLSALIGEYVVDLMDVIHGPLSDGSYDIVLGSDHLVGVLKCVGSAHNIPVVLVGTTTQAVPHHYPQWAWPSVVLEASSDNLSFLQRVISVLDKWTTPLLYEIIYMYPSKSSLENYCPGVALSELSFSSGINFPSIVPTVIGFEYARTRFPLTEYVGPLLPRYPTPLSEEIAKWLARKTERSVVYVSMGSLCDLNKESGRAILEGVMDANHSLLWSMKTSNQWILEGLELDPDRVLISEWTPQFSVLASKAIHSAILHGGFNGISEALWNGVPVIGTPLKVEQVLNIGRVLHKGLGSRLSSDNMTSSAVADALAALDAGDYSTNVRRLQKMFRFAGGARRAADLVEHYEEVGYAAHLVPSYVKYRWSWMNYYNTDLLLVLVFLMASFGTIVKCLRTKCTAHDGIRRFSFSSLTS